MPYGTWNPRTIRRFIESIPTSTSVARVDTDAGEGFVKTLGNPEGPHVLACELVGTLLAAWMGIPTLDAAIITVDQTDEIPLAGGRLAEPGPAFITRAEEGFAWGGDSATLQKVLNQGDISRLVVLDTWIRNCDRYRPEPALRINRDNVFLAKTPAPGLVLKAIDHTHAFTCGRELTRRLSDIDQIQDGTLFGCFPAFRPLVTAGEIGAAADRLRAMDRAEAQRIVGMIPGEWQVAEDARSAWVRLIHERAGYVARHIEGWLWPGAGVE